MAAQKTTASLVNRLGKELDDAVTKHRGDETEYSQFGDLPAGIEGAIAQITEIGFKQIKQGKEGAGNFYFQGVGIVVEPAEFKGERIYGRRTTIMESMYPTPKSEGRKTIEEHTEWVLNELRKLGVDTSGFRAVNLEPACAKLEKEKPYFKFRTWKGNDEELITENGQLFVVRGKIRKGPYKDEATAKAKHPYLGKPSKINHSWNGKCEAPKSAPGGVAGALAGTSDGYQNTGENGQDESDSIDVLLDKCKHKDRDAQNELSALAIRSGFTREQIDAVKSWDEVYEMVKNAKPSANGSPQMSVHVETPAGEAIDDTEDDSEPYDPPATAPDTTDTEEDSNEVKREPGFTEKGTPIPEDDDEEEEGVASTDDEQEEEAAVEDTTPKVGEVRLYLPPADPRNPKQAMKPIKIEVLSGPNEKGKYVVKSLKDGKTKYNHVPAAKLQPLQ